MRSLFVACAVLSPAVLAGTAHVVSHCASPVYYAVYYAESPKGQTSMAPLPPGGYSESYGTDNAGVSIKLAQSLEMGNITQLEFTPSGANINYDISDINGNAFSSGGLSLVPAVGESSQYPTCVPINCPAGLASCTAAYNQPDDVRTKVCAITTDLTLTLCLDTSGGTNSSGTANTTSGATAPSASPLARTSSGASTWPFTTAFPRDRHARRQRIVHIHSHPGSHAMYRVI